MIKTITSPKIDFLIEAIVGNNDVLAYNPIIAGGSMLSVYRAFRLYDTESKWNQLKRSIEYMSLQGSGQSALNLDKFGDIDMWFSKSSSVHSEGDFSWVLFDKDRLAPLYGDLPKPLGQEYRSVKTSKWANSFRKKRAHLSSGGSFILQFIKKPVDSIDNLFKDFDFINCCVAYYDGTLYYDSRLDSSFESFELSLNNPSNYEGDSIAKKVYAGLRAFKYSKRYHLDFSEKLSYLIYKIYLDLDSIDYESYENKVILANDVYGKVLMSKNDLKDMVRSLENCFPNFIKMKTFKEEYAIYLLDRQNLKGLRAFFNKDDAFKSKISLDIPF